jgi:hypothetical protein
MILAEDRSLQTSIKMIIRKADGNDRWKNQMAPRVVSDWVTAFGSVCFVPTDALLGCILQPLQSLPREMFRQLHANVEYLVFSRDDISTQKINCIKFDDYLRLMFRYGPRQCRATTVCELTNPESAHSFTSRLWAAVSIRNSWTCFFFL